MNLKQLFEKPIDRSIEGVIKADDTEHLRTEVEEYVLTADIGRKLDRLLDAYNQYENANGVWISGFFGSGKSHLLKMLSLLLEGRDVDGLDVSAAFQNKIKDSLTRAAIGKARKIPSQSILFNIDQKADLITKDETDALLAVFVKVFNELQGYYPKLGYIANFERDIDRKGIYQKFRDAYLKETGRTWEADRDIAHNLENETFAKVYSEVADVTYDEALKVLDRYHKNYRVSIEEFAERVKEYIDGKEPGFRLNFFVDEVGQFIANNTRFMVNLQTIAESLNTKCRGQAWVMVTSQEEMDTVIGDLSRSQANDFTKIQARFNTRVNLTSSDVEEVIQRRLLDKKSKENDPSVRAALEKIFKDEHANFPTLFLFAEGSQTYKTYRDESHFVNCYPFVPYQFPVFQLAIKGLSGHNAFTGRHSSVGERSMLGVFQEVVKAMADLPIGHIATFDRMFEGIRNVLKSELQTSIHIAEKNLSNELAVCVLKALFLVKFVRVFKATADNIAILMIDRLEVKVGVHAKNVKEALNLLENENYIRRTGLIYEFLTDEEKDVEKEIKDTDLDDSAVNELIVDIVFREILPSGKIRCESNKQDYTFARKLDSQLAGKDAELAINLITPFNEHHGNDSILTSQSLGKSELLVVLPAAPTLMTDLRNYKKTEKFIQQNNSATLSDVRKNILVTKAQQNSERRSNLRRDLEEFLTKARFHVGGALLEITSSDAETCLIKGFQSLITTAYPNLKMLKSVFTEDNLRSILLDSEDDLFKHDDSLTEAEQEILTILTRMKNRAERATVAGLLEEFARKPYGWYQAATLCNLARLFMRGKVEIKSDSNTLDEKQVHAHLTNNRQFANTIVGLQEEFSSASVRRLKNFHHEFFDETNDGAEAKQVALEFQNRLRRELTELDGILDLQPQYPFLSALEKPRAEVSKLVEREYTFYLKEQASFEDSLMEAKEDLLDSVKEFINGGKKTVYDSIAAFMNSNRDNLKEIEGTEAEELDALLVSSRPFAGSLIQSAKIAKDALEKKVLAALTAAREDALSRLGSLERKLESYGEFKSLGALELKEVTAPFQTQRERIESTETIPVIRDAINSFSSHGFTGQVKKMGELAAKQSGDDAAKPPAQYAESFNIKPEFAKPCLVDEADVDAYLAGWKEVAMKEIKAGKRIII
jgi:hypothetical protein